MAPESVNEYVRDTCRKFLNTKAGLSLDPALFVDKLSAVNAIDQNDAELVRSQPSLPHRQYVFFLEILPTKSHDTVWTAVDVFRSSGRHEALAFAEAVLSALEPESSARRYFFSTRAWRAESEDGAQEELIVQHHVSQSTVESGGANGEGSAGDQVVTPEGLHDDSVDGSRLNAADIELSDIIGNGAFAVVHVGTHAGQQVAVKRFISYDNFALTMFMAEVGIMRKLDHPNLVRFVGYVRNTNDKQLWLLTEFVPGGSMRRFCQSDPSLPIGDKLKISVGCWCGLAYLHSRKCCHKDISPNNILVSSDLTRVKIADFGLSEFKTLMITAATEIKGTAMYQPPEFACNSGTVAMRHPIKSDVYSMGASLCELFSERWFWHIGGRPRTSMQVCCQLLKQRESVDINKPPCEPDCWTDVPDLAKSMLKDAINPDYKKRKTASELKQMTEDILAAY